MHSANAGSPIQGGVGAGANRMASAIVTDLKEIGSCRVALIGLPDETGVRLNNGRPGARVGPAAFRTALARYGVAEPMGDTADDRPTAYPLVFDAGDVEVGGDIHETHGRVSEAAAAVAKRGLFPIAIGGGHDLTFAFVRGVARGLGGAPLGGTYFDAHLDVRPEVGSGMPFRALIEGGFVEGRRLSCIGLNSLVTAREHAAYFRGKGGMIVTAAELGTGPSDVVRGRGPAFVSLDMDVFDSAFAPGVSALNPSGLSPREVEPMIRAAGRSADVRCFDIMELNPAHDVDGRTARLAAHMFLTFLRGLSERSA